MTSLSGAPLQTSEFLQGSDLRSVGFADREAAGVARQHDGDGSGKDDDPGTSRRTTERCFENCKREAHRRAVRGAPEAVVKSGASATNPATGTPITVRKYSDALLIMLLKANRAKSIQDDGQTERGVLEEIATDPEPQRSNRGRAG